jgi:hypothetical protein
MDSEFITMKQSVLRKAGKPILTREIVGKVVACLKPAIAQLLALHERKFLHLIVLDPVDGETVVFDGPVAGELKDYPRPYREIALEKARLSARTGMDTAEVHTRAAHLLAAGDVVYQGGVNYRGLVVSASGAQGPVDEAVSLTVAAQLAAWCQVQLQKLQSEAAKGGPFLVPGS